MSSWYIHKNLKPQGPLTFDEMKKKIMRGEIHPDDLVMKVGEAGSQETWIPTFHWRDFPQDLFPAFQKNLFKTSSVEEKEWILLVFTDEGTAPSQAGPYSVMDVKERLASGQISFEDYVWRTGLSGWVRVRDRAEFHGSPKAATSPDL